MKNIFFLHNEPSLLYAYKDFLETMGYQVFITTNHYEFLLYVKEINTDLIIYDAEDNFVQPFMDMVSEIINKRKIPFILIMKKDVDVALPSVVTYFLRKPFEPFELANIIRKQFNSTVDMAKFYPPEHFFYVDKKEKAQDLQDILR